MLGLAVQPGPPKLLFAISALIGAFAAASAGVCKEARDDDANQAAAAAGETLPHEVSRADILATALGAAPVVVPLLLLQALVGFV